MPIIDPTTRGVKAPGFQETSKQLQIVKIGMVLDCARFCAYSNKKKAPTKNFVSA